MRAATIFLLSVAIVRGYNVDTTFPIFRSDRDASKKGDSYFGYTVHLYRDSANDTSWLIVGAPKANYSSLPSRSANPIEPGVVYRCAVKSDTCEEIRPQSIENEEYSSERLARKVLIQKERSWFGSAISVDQSSGRLTVCAPRTILTILHPSIITMQGMCYIGQVSSSKLEMEKKDLEVYDFGVAFWYNPLHGFSVHYPSTKKNHDRKKTEINRIIGQPKRGDDGAVYITYANSRMIVRLPASDELSQFGYSVESGHFFKKDELYFVSSAPGWHYVGAVAIINPTLSTAAVVARLHGTDFGEYFGASLAVGDLDGDGLDDLLIGAPHWGEDNGKVYAYFSTFKGQFELVATLQGTAEGGHFGYAINCGDLDTDGFDDIIVGAPWEENGVIYIYNGGPDLKDTNLQVSQRIEAAALSRFGHSGPMQRFGFSISKPIDIDRNGYSDIAIGAYKSQHAVILRSRRVLQTEFIFSLNPPVLKSDTELFAISICPQYTGYTVASRKSLKVRITITIDEQYRRTRQTFLELNSYNLTKYDCVAENITFWENVRDRFEPINILVRHEFAYKDLREFCEFCPVEKRGNKRNIAQLVLPFDIGCGEDNVCDSNISATVQFHNVRSNDTWVIGSGDISLEASIQNHGEYAYLTSLEFALPEKVVLRSILPSCQEDTSGENLIVICDTGNPISEGEQKNVKLDLDMRHLINGSLSNKKLYFHIEIKTRSKNHGTTNIVKPLTLINEVSLSLQGKANDEAYYLSASNEAARNISFQHTYQVYKLGASPIEDAQLIVNVPLAVNRSETLVHVYKPQLYTSGEILECSSQGTLLDPRLSRIQEEPSLGQFDLPMLSYGTQQTEQRLKEKRDVEDLYSTTNYKTKTTEISEASNESFSANTIYMNCSSPDVTCTTITCDLSAVKTLQVIGKLAINFLLDTDKLKENFRNNKTILKFATAASVEIIKPEARLHVNGSRSSMEVVTRFYDTPKVEKLQLWIILVSVSVGLLFLLVIVVILSTAGFFKRKQKEDLIKSKNEEATLMVTDMSEST